MTVKRDGSHLSMVNSKKRANLRQMTLSRREGSALKTGLGRTVVSKSCF
jgi:hypothetical protein